MSKRVSLLIGSQDGVTPKIILGPDVPLSELRKKRKEIISQKGKKWKWVGMIKNVSLSSFRTMDGDYKLTRVVTPLGKKIKKAAEALKAAQRERREAKPADFLSLDNKIVEAQAAYDALRNEARADVIQTGRAGINISSQTPIAEVGTSAADKLKAEEERKAEEEARLQEEEDAQADLLAPDQGAEGAEDGAESKPEKDAKKDA